MVRADNITLFTSLGNLHITHTANYSKTCSLNLSPFLGKCDWRSMPEVTDSELDRLMAECQPRQLVIVSVYSSKHPEATPCDAMVEEIFYGINYRCVCARECVCLCVRVCAVMDPPGVRGGGVMTG